jgi:hypothetical protein
MLWGTTLAMSLLKILTAARAPVPGVSVAQGLQINRVCRVILGGSQDPRPRGVEETL